MSYHTRTYNSGGAHYDPRQLTWAVFHCDVCGKDEEVNITGRTGTFLYNAPRKCPHCQSFGKQDKIIALRKEIDTLTSTKGNIEVMIEQLTEQLEMLSGSSQEVS